MEGPHLSSSKTEKIPPHEEPSQKIEELLSKQNHIVTKWLDRINTLLKKFKESGHLSEQAEQGIADEVEEIQETVGLTLKRIKEQLGSNDGGFYEDEETGGQYYVKFYENPDQGRSEVVANMVYQRLGIPSPVSAMEVVNGKLAFTSVAIPGTERLSDDEFNDADVQGGFVADAFLANWDVVGLVKDNIVKDAEGNCYRIDNGGSLLFRAQGLEKDFTDEVTEVDSLRDPSINKTSAEVFRGVTDEEIQGQVRHLANTLSGGDIETLVSGVGFDKEQEEKIIKTLKARRRFLIDTYLGKGFQGPTERIPRAVEEIEAMVERYKDLEFLPRVGIISDSGSIENQEVDLIQGPESTYLNFKLTNESWKKLRGKLNEAVPDKDKEEDSGTFRHFGGSVVEVRICEDEETGINAGDELMFADGIFQECGIVGHENQEVVYVGTGVGTGDPVIQFSDGDVAYLHRGLFKNENIISHKKYKKIEEVSANKEGETKQELFPGMEILSGRMVYKRGRACDVDEEFHISDAWEIHRDGIIVRVSKGSRSGSGVRTTMYSSRGLVEIEIPHDSYGGSEDLGIQVDKILKGVLGVEGGLKIPEPEDERAYKHARYTWHHKREGSLMSEEEMGDIERLTREEVFPGYFTMVDRGKSEKYETKYGPIKIYHQINSQELLSKIIKSGGLMSSHERYKRGLLVSGMSTTDDFTSGGADSVFTRIMMERGLTAHVEDECHVPAVSILISPRVLERTDWYAYHIDNYGDTETSVFEKRLPPDKFFARQIERGFGEMVANEQMFRTGISVEDFDAIVCYNENTRSNIVESLVNDGIDMINGIPTGEFVVVARTDGEFVALASQQHGGAGLSPAGDGVGDAGVSGMM